MIYSRYASLCDPHRTRPVCVPHATARTSRQRFPHFFVPRAGVRSLGQRVRRRRDALHPNRPPVYPRLALPPPPARRHRRKAAGQRAGSDQSADEDRGAGGEAEGEAVTATPSSMSHSLRTSSVPTYAKVTSHEIIHRARALFQRLSVHRPIDRIGNRRRRRRRTRRPAPVTHKPHPSQLNRSIPSWRRTDTPSRTSAAAGAWAHPPAPSTPSPPSSPRPTRLPRWPCPDTVHRRLSR